ncbi:glycosyltransferase family 39 protein [Limibacter armeniacum]|uniref:ArnT family glycosyltransferase n=1 Tax=Limibacter armeniacum TaxID=466084 RepID=UPI002FE51BD3
MRIHKSYIIFLLSVLVFFANSWGYSIFILDEAKNAECAREMLEQGNWFLPTFNYELRTDKPPLHYYFMMLSYSVFGATAFAARFFSSVMGILTVLSTYFFTKKFLGDGVAFFAALVFLASIQMSVQFHLAVPDPYLIFFTNLGIFSFLMGLEKRETKYLYLMYVSISLAVLAKGPVAVALPGLTFLLYLVLTRQLKWEVIKWLKIPQGVLLTILIVFPVYLKLGLDSDWEWLKGFFLEHNVGRFTSTMEGHGGNVLYIPIVMLAGLLPFSLFFPQALRKAWEFRNEPLLMLAIIDVTVFAVFFTVSRTKLPTYPEPCYPFAAIILGYFVHHWTQQSFKKQWVSVGIFVFLGIAMPLGGFIGLSLDPNFAYMKWDALVFLPVTFGSAFALVLVKRGKLKKAAYAMAAGFIVLGMGAHYIVFPSIDQNNPVTKSKALALDDTELAFYGYLIPANVFAEQRKIPKLHSINEVKQFLKKPNSRLISEKRSIEELKKIDGLQIYFEHKDLFENKTMYIVGF